MGLLNKQNKKDVTVIDFEVSVSTYNDDDPYKISAMESEIYNLARADLSKLLTDKEYTKKQIYTIWSSIMNDYSLEKFSIECKVLPPKRIRISLRKEIDGRLIYTMNAYIEFDKETYEFMEKKYKVMGFAEKLPLI